MGLMEEFGAIDWPVTALTVVIQTSLVLGAGLIVAVKLRRYAPRVAHALWGWIFVLVALLPVVSQLAPSWGVPILAAGGGSDRGSAIAAEFTAGDDAAALASMAKPATGITTEAHPISSASRPSGSIFRTWAKPAAGAALALWLSGTVLMAAVVLFGILRMRFLARSGEVIRDRRWQGELDRLLRKLGIRRDVRLVSVQAASMPMTGGLFRTVIVLPPAATTWDAQRIRVVLLHELIHVKRYDWCTDLIGQLGRAMYWFNPLMWMALRDWRLVCELCCDERVVANGTRPSLYAELLMDFADQAGARRNAWTASPAIAKRHYLEERLMAILKPPTMNRVGFATLPLLGAVLAVSVMSAVMIRPVRQARIQAAHAARVRALRTAELQERVVTRIRTAPGELDELFDSQMDAVVRTEEWAQTQSESVQEQLAPQIEQLLESADPTIVIHQLNKNLDVRRRSIVDFANGRSRHEDIDLRPVDKLAEQHGLTVMQRWSLNQSSTHIQKQGESIHLIPHVDRLAILSDDCVREYSAAMERLKFGLIPERLFAAEDCKLYVESGSDESNVRLIGRTGGADASPRFVAILKRGPGFLMTRFTEFDDSGATVLEWVGSDFRPVGSVMVPFQTVLTFPSRGIDDYHVQKRTVERVDLNVDVDDASFEIPADYRVQDLRRSKNAVAERSKPQAESPAKSETDELKKGDAETRQPAGERGSGSADGQAEARVIQEGTEDEAPSRTIVRNGRADEDEWKRYTREFITRFKLDDAQRNAAWRILSDCKEQRTKYLASKRERIVQLQQGLSANKSHKADRLLREFENARRELEELKRPIVKIFEKQLKPRLDKVPTRAQRAVADKSELHNAPEERESNAGGRP